MSPALPYSSGDVARMSGVSLRQLQWWDEHGVIKPRIEGHRRVYTERDIAELMLIGALRKKNVSLQKIRRALVHLRKHIEGMAIFDGHSYLLVDLGCKAVVIAKDPVTICDLMDRSTKPMLMVKIPELGVRAVAPRSGERR